MADQWGNLASEVKQDEWAGMASPIADSEQDHSFLDTVGSNMQKRMDAVKNAPDALNKGISIARYAVGGVGDIAGAAIGQIPTTQGVKNTLSAAAEGVSNMPVVKNVSGYLDENPTLKNALGLGMDVAAAVPAGMVGKAAAPVAVDAAIGAAKTIAKAPATVARGAASAITPNIPKRTATLLSRADGFGFKLRADQYNPTRLMNTAQKVSQEIPGSGVGVNDELNNKVFHEQLAKTIGQNADDLGPETILKFAEDSSNKFKTALGTGDFKVNGSDFEAIAKIENALPKSVTNDIADIVKQHTKQFRDDLMPQSAQKVVADEFGSAVEKTAKNGGQPIINTEKLASLRSDLIQSMKDIDPKARPHVAKIIDVIDGIAERNISPKNVNLLKQVRREWRNFKTIEPLLEGSTDGTINPTQLITRVKTSKFIKASKLPVGEDDLVDLARIGKKFLVKKGGSDTLPKSMIAGNLLAPTTAFAVGGLPGGLASLALQGATMAGNRGLQAINKSKTIRDLAIKKGLK